jgi:symplekin
MISSKDTVRITHLKHVQELILHKIPTLLDNFLEEVLQFQLDKSSEVKKFVISFIEEACKRDHEVIFKVIDNFRYLLYDENVAVQKRAYLAMITIFKNTIKWIAKSKTAIDGQLQDACQSLLAMKDHVTAQLDSDNDGIRTVAIKFIEMLILILSSRTKDSLVPNFNKNDLSIDKIGDDHPVLNRMSLQEEGLVHMRKLLEYTLSTHISSVNLISSICVLSNIAKQRPDYIQTVIETFDKLLGFKFTYY